MPLRKIIPGLWGIDMATLLLVIVFTAAKLSLVYTLTGYAITPLLVTVSTLLETVDLLLNVFLYAIIIQAILSWVNPDPYNPIVGLLNSLSWPVLKHFRKLVPPISGFDISPIFAIIAIMFVKQSIHYIIKMFL